MTLAAPVSSSPRTAFEPSPTWWLTCWARPAGRNLALARVFTVLDVLPAIGFALGLAGAVGRLAERDGSVWPWLMLAGVSLCLRAGLGQWVVIKGAASAASAKAGVRRGVLTGLFAGRRTGPDGVSAAVEGVEALDGYYTRFAAAKTAAAATPILIVVAVALASPIAAGILLFAMIPFVGGMALAGMAAASESRRQFDALQRLSGLFLDRVRALPVLIAFQAETRASAEIGRAADELERRTGRVLKIAFLSSGVLEFFAALSVALVAVYCGFNLLRLLPFHVPETLTLTRAFFVLALAPEVYAPLRRLSAAYHDRQAAEAAAASLAAASAPTPSRTRARIVWKNPPPIAFWGVDIRYGIERFALSGFDLDVPAGAVVALTGPSGSGKSSLLHLLLGLAPLTGGDVEVGDWRLSQSGSFAGSVGWASQTPIMVPGTVSANIALARRGASTSDILRAASQAGLTGDLDRRLNERGGGLSGGERRRLGLARAFLSPSRILLLDEPTANLDAATELELIEVLRRVSQGRTTLIATHSTAVIALADQVVRL
ncbi:thiol reductant ABC exporter subunit CydD [soil metagenome]